MSEEQVVAYAILRSPDGSSIVDAGPITAENVDRYRVDDQAMQDAASRITELGFHVTESGPASLTLIGPKDLFEHVFGTRLEVREEVMSTDDGGVLGRYHDARDPIRVPEDLAPLVARIEVAQPPLLFS